MQCISDPSMSYVLMMTMCMRSCLPMLAFRCLHSPLWLMVLEDFALCVVAQDSDIDEAAQIELL